MLPEVTVTYARMTALLFLIPLMLKSLVRADPLCHSIARPNIHCWQTTGELSFTLSLKRILQAFDRVSSQLPRKTKIDGCLSIDSKSSLNGGSWTVESFYYGHPGLTVTLTGFANSTTFIPCTATTAIGFNCGCA